MLSFFFQMTEMSADHDVQQHVHRIKLKRSRYKRKRAIKNEIADVYYRPRLLILTWTKLYVDILFHYPTLNIKTIYEFQTIFISIKKSILNSVVCIRFADSSGYDHWDLDCYFDFTKSCRYFLISVYL